MRPGPLDLEDFTSLSSTILNDRVTLPRSLSPFGHCRSGGGTLVQFLGLLRVHVASLVLHDILYCVTCYTTF